jgi:hypothetical protein
VEVEVEVADGRERERERIRTAVSVFCSSLFRPLVDLLARNAILAVGAGRMHERRRSAHTGLAGSEAHASIGSNGCLPERFM